MSFGPPGTFPPPLGNTQFAKWDDSTQSKEICPFYAQGSCTFGDGCFNVHAGPIYTEKELCPFFLKGFCGFGDKCFKVHGAIPASAPKSWVPVLKQHPSVNDVSKTVEITKSKVKDVMGIKGTNIRKIQQISGVYKIKVLDEDGGNSKGPEDTVVVEIKGNAASVEVAYGMILAVASGDQSCIGNIEEAMEVESRLVSKIIGTGGEVIQEMQKRSGCRLAVRGGERGTNQLPKLMLTGTPEAVASARAMVNEYINTFADRPSQDIVGNFQQEAAPSDACPWEVSADGTGWVARGSAAAAKSAAAATPEVSVPAAAAPPDFAAFSAAAMESAQQMAMLQMQQMMAAQAAVGGTEQMPWPNMMGMQADSSASQFQAAGQEVAAAKKVDRQVEAGSANLANSLREKMLASRKRARGES